MTKFSKREKRKRKKIAKQKATHRALNDRNRERKLAENILRFGRSLTRRQFDAYCYCRLPLVRFTAEEIEWYSLINNKLLAVVIRDKTDNDYGFVVLGRDTRKLFRCIEVCSEFYSSSLLARKALSRKIHQDYKNKVQDIYPQDDESDAGFNLFINAIPESEQHHGYKILKNEPRYEAARNIISEIVNSFVDNDGHFEREFQSGNFQAKLWELYLHIYIHNAGFLVENHYAAPDFEISYFGEKSFIEAVTVNPSENKNRPDLPPPKTEEEIQERLNDFMPIKFGSPLYSKLQKRYWEKKHVTGKPLIIAIHDYHNDNAMTWSRTALSEYLYGIRSRVINGTPVIKSIDTHSWEGKEIPSGFFYQEDTENISAVLFSNQATIPKFNRMGKLAGLGSENVKMIRTGFLYNPNPEAITPIPFSKDLDDSDYEESWSDGLVMFHNPNAKYPQNPRAFSDISHVFYSKEAGFHGFHQPYDVLGSITVAITETPESI